MNHHIKCNVCSCYYNNNEYCNAAHIEVSNCHCHGHDATTSEQTECCTFKQK